MSQRGMRNTKPSSKTRIEKKSHPAGRRLDNIFGGYNFEASDWFFAGLFGFERVRWGGGFDACAGGNFG